MKQELNQERVDSARLAVSRFFEMSMVRKAPAKEVIAYGRQSGLHRAEIKAARRLLGVKSANENGEYWWEWPEGTDPGEMNRQISREVLENAGKGD